MTQNMSGMVAALTLVNVLGCATGATGARTGDMMQQAVDVQMWEVVLVNIPADAMVLKVVVQLRNVDSSIALSYSVDNNHLRMMVRANEVPVAFQISSYVEDDPTSPHGRAYCGPIWLFVDRVPVRVIFQAEMTSPDPEYTTNRSGDLVQIPPWSPRHCEYRPAR